MIQVKNIWDNLKDRSLADKVSIEEIWLKSGELKEFIKRRKVLVGLNTDVFIYFFLSLLICVFLMTMIFIFIQKRIIYGIAIALIDILFIREVLFKRYTGHFYLLEDGIVQGIFDKKIVRLYHVNYTYIPFDAISKIIAKRDSHNSKLVNIHIIT